MAMLVIYLSAQRTHISFESVKRQAESIYRFSIKCLYQRCMKMPILKEKNLCALVIFCSNRMSSRLNTASSTRTAFFPRFFYFPQLFLFLLTRVHSLLNKHIWFYVRSIHCIIYLTKVYKNIESRQSNTSEGCATVSSLNFKDFESFLSE